MGLYYKKDILASLKEAGYSTNRLRTEKIMSESVIQNLRKKRGVGFDTIEKLCKLLKCQPGDVIGFNNDDERVRRFERQAIKDVPALVHFGQDLCINEEYIRDTIITLVKRFTE